MTHPDPARGHGQDECPPATLVPADTPWTALHTLAQLRAWSDARLLRHLDTALAAFVLEHAPQAAPCVLVATALLVHMEGRGHTCLPLDALVAAPQQVLGWTEEGAQALQTLWAQLPQHTADWRQALAACPAVRVAGQAHDQGQPLVLLHEEGGGAHLYLRRYWNHERLVAHHIQERSAHPEQLAALDTAVVRGWLERFFPSDGAADPCHWQKVACALALRGRITVITGGPGTGKTYTAARLLALLFATAPDAGQLRVALAAPTGKAAARLKQSIDSALGKLQQQVGAALDLAALVQRMGAARTLHALLGARPGTRHMGRQAGRVLDVDVLIVDEASMVHLEMMSALLDALAPGARLVLLGDKDQLASVEAGAVLADLCLYAEQGHYSPYTVAWVAAATAENIPATHQARGTPPALAQQTVMLRASRRFGGDIGAVAQAVNAGEDAAVQALLQSATLHAGGPVAQAQGLSVPQVVLLALHGRAGAVGYGPFAQALAQGRGRDWAGAEGPQAHAAWVLKVLQAFERFRLLCAVREGDWGVAGLNRSVEQALESAGAIRRQGLWYAGRPVMVTRNDAALGVFNGDIGVALPSARAGEALRVYFLQGQEVRSVGVTRLAQVETAFAMTVHKSQGSEFEHTALVLAASGGAVLGRELVYTGITRARHALTLLAERPGLLSQAIARPTQRASGLARWLRG